MHGNSERHDLPSGAANDPFRCLASDSEDRVYDALVQLTKYTNTATFPLREIIALFLQEIHRKAFPDDRFEGKYSAIMAIAALQQLAPMFGLPQVSQARTVILVAKVHSIVRLLDRGISSVRAAAAPRTRPSATCWASPRWIPHAMAFYSRDSYPRNATSRGISMWISSTSGVRLSCSGYSTLRL